MTFKKLKTKLTIIIFFIIITTNSALFANETILNVADINTSGEEGKCELCDLFEIAEIYKNKDNAFIQSFKFNGRYMGQWYYVDAGESGTDDAWENRRWRIGAKAKLFKKLEVFGAIDLNKDNKLEGRFIDKLNKFGIKYKFSDYVSLVIGKLTTNITREESISSKKIHTLERSMLVDQLTPDNIASAILQTQIPAIGLKTQIGILSGSNDDDFEVPKFDGGYGIFFSVAYDMTENTEIRFDYLYNDGDENNNAFADYENTFSINSASKWGRFGLDTDLLYATGLGDVGDVYGLVLIPYYDIIPKKLQFVLRYHFASSNQNDGLGLQKRYDGIVDELKESGDLYHSIYSGLNLFICEDKLKIMNGVQYSDLSGGENDYDGVSFVTGIRMYF